MRLLQELTQHVCNVRNERGHGTTKSFTVEHYRIITWAIIDDGRAHFDDVKTTLDFQGLEEPAFPQSYLLDILRNVRYAIPVE